MITVLKTRGASEKPGQNFLSGALAPLDPAKFRVLETEYPASIGPDNPGGDPVGPSLSQSVNIAVTDMRTKVVNSPDPVVLVDYSLGGICGSEYLRRHGTAKVAGRIALANPTRATGDTYGRPSSGRGVYDHQFGYPPGFRHWELCSPGDLICSAPALSPWRWVATDLLTDLTLSPAGLAAWAAQMVARLPQIEADAVGADFGLVWNPQWWVEIGQAPGWLYAFTQGAHTTAYLQPDWRTSAGKPITALALLTKILVDYWG